MPELVGQAATQLANIERETGLDLAHFTEEIAGLELEKHGQIVAHLKSEHALGHGNANLIAKLVRDELSGGPGSADDLFAAQYAGAKETLKPIFHEVAAIATALGPDVEQVVQKTGVSFRRRKQFLLVQAPSSKRVQLGLNLDETPADGRVTETSGMCTHRVDVATPDEVDDAVAAWIRSAYQSAG
jgi:hypothetical protein